jgi:hypothetical protein
MYTQCYFLKTVFSHLHFFPKARAESGLLGAFLVGWGISPKVAMPLC